MTQRVSPTLIGAFMLGALVLVAVGVVLFGSGKWFKDTAACVMYFEGDVQGLNVGAAVKFRGVKIGEVTSISTRLDRKTLEVRIPVYVDLIDPDAQLYGRSVEGEPEDPIRALVDRGLRAQLQAESLVTGQLFVQLDFYPDAPTHPGPALDPLSRRHEIPTVPTILQKAQTTLRQVLEKVEKLPLEEMLASLQGALAGANALLNSPELRRAPTDAAETLAEVRAVAAKLDAESAPLLARADRAIANIDRAAQALVPLAASGERMVQTIDKLAANDAARVLGEIERTAQEAQRALAQTRATMTSVEELTLPTSAVGHQLREALTELTAAARAVRGLADALEAQPNAVLFGKQPESAP